MTPPMIELAAYLIILATCWVIAAGTFHAIKWMILNWPDDSPPAIVKWLQKSWPN